MEKFSQIDTWVFDLDNTLYPRHCDLFAQIDVLMTGYVSQLTGLEPVEARKLQKELYRDYGTTLRGLMERHDIDPHDFLNVVHDIDYSLLPKNRELGDMISGLPGRKLIYTNGSVEHAKNTLEALDIDHRMFDSIFDIVASDFEPKPHPGPFVKFLNDHHVNGSSAAMFEDLPRNLEPAKTNGIITVLVTPQDSAGAGNQTETWEHTQSNAPYIDHQTDDLDGFIKNILTVL